MKFTYNHGHISSLIPTVKFATVLGLTPWFNFQTYKLQFKNWFRCYSMVLAFLSIVLFVRFLINQRYDPQVTINIANILSQLSGQTSLLLTILSASFWNRDSWNKLFNQLRILENWNYVNKTELFLANPNWIFLICTVCYWSLVSFQLFAFWKFSTPFLCMAILFYLQFVVVNLYINLVLLIKCKYKEASELLSWVTHSSKFIRVGEMYLVIDDIVATFNGIFGWPILGIIFGLFCQILHCLLIFTTIADKIRVLLFAWLTMGLAVVINVIGPVTLMFCCESTIAEAKKLLGKCYKLHQLVPSGSREDKELSKLENLIKNNPPVFTAAGFFEINRLTLLYLLSTITTYYIVGIQFKDT